eukprot:2448651-Rhodomonas_salina.1
MAAVRVACALIDICADNTVPGEARGAGTRECPRGIATSSQCIAVVRHRDAFVDIRAAELQEDSGAHAHVTVPRLRVDAHVADLHGPREESGYLRVPVSIPREGVAAVHVGPRYPV